MGSGLRAIRAAVVVGWALFSAGGLVASSTPDGIYRPWDGEWKGEFAIYSPTGEKRSIQVHHVYRSRSDTHQDVEIFDTLPDGATIRKTATNTVEDGRLVCRVFEEDGRLEVEHQGALVDGYLIWSSRDADGRVRQVFRERVVGDLYTIDGFGIYGAQREVVEIYAGRYRRVGSQ